MKNRFYSLDVFRGATVALMILVNNPGSWSFAYLPLKHAPWHGCTPTDLVFPFFLFAVGNAMAFVMPRLQAAGTPVFLGKVFKRAFLIFLIGLLLNWAPFIKWEAEELVFKSFSGVRIFGVLQRIALAYLFASLIVYFFKPAGALIASLVILLGYWLLCLWLGNPADPYSLEGFFGTHVDRALLGSGHIYKGEGVDFDPEGLVSTLAAIVQVIFGFLVGDYLRKNVAASASPIATPELPSGKAGISASSREASSSENNNPASNRMYRVLTMLFLSANACLFVAFCWDMVFPINKKIWTSSYVLYTTGLAIIILSITIYLIEIRGSRGTLTRFFDVFGKNPLFIYVLSGLIPRLQALIRIFDHKDEKGNNVYLTPFGWFYEHVCKPLFDHQNNASLLYALCMVAMYWLIGFWMDKKKVYVKV